MCNHEITILKEENKLKKLMINKMAFVLISVILFSLTSCSASTTKTYKIPLKSGETVNIECASDYECTFTAKDGETIRAVKNGKEIAEVIPVDANEAKSYFERDDISTDPAVVECSEARGRRYLLLEADDNGTKYWMCMIDASNSIGICLRAYESIDVIYDLLNNVDFY